MATAPRPRSPRATAHSAPLVAGNGQNLLATDIACGSGPVSIPYAWRNDEGGHLLATHGASATMTNTCSTKGRSHVAQTSPIEWTEATWNPTTGCDRTSPGCDNCYALTLAKRLKAMGVNRYQNDGDPRTSGPGFKLTTHDDALGVPRQWKQPRLVFVNSMSDLFHDDVPEPFIRSVFEVMSETPRHTYQILTKRTKRLLMLASVLNWAPNVWMGVSVESARYRFRIDHLRACIGSIHLSRALNRSHWGGGPDRHRLGNSGR